MAIVHTDVNLQLRQKKKIMKDDTTLICLIFVDTTSCTFLQWDMGGPIFPSKNRTWYTSYTQVLLVIDI